MPFTRPRESVPDAALVRARLDDLLGQGSEGGVDAWGPGDVVGQDVERGRGPDDRADGEPAVSGGRWRPTRADLARRTDSADLLGLPAEDGSAAGRHRAGDRAGDRAVPLLSVPRSLRGAQVRVNPAALIGMLLLVLLAALVFGWRVWQAERAAVPVPVAPVPAGDPAAGTPEGDGPGEQPDGDEPGEQPDGEAAAGAPVIIVVHVDGAVQAPGVVELEQGARVREAVGAAGGLTPEADTGRINLARPLVDGERLWVPVPGEEEPEVIGQSGVQPGGAAASPGGDDPGSGGGSSVDLNAADQTALESLPGVGPVTAERILAWRQEHGPFNSAEELLEVSGIGPRTLEQLRPHLTW